MGADVLREVAGWDAVEREPTVRVLIPAALRLIRRAPPALWAAWAGAAVVLWATKGVPLLLGLDPDDLPAILHWLREVIEGLLTSLLSAFALRAWLSPGPSWWRPDRAFAAYVLISTMGALAFAASEEVAQYPWAAGLELPLRVAVSLDLATQLVVPLLALGAILLLMLWPMSLLARDPLVTPQRSLRLMWPTIGSYSLACLVVALPAVLGLAAAIAILSRLHWPVVQEVAEDAAGATVVMFGLAAAAVVYHLQVRRHAEVVAVFD